VYSKKTPDAGQRNCPKHVKFDSKNKFEKLVRLVGFIIRMASFNSFCSSDIVLVSSDQSCISFFNVFLVSYVTT